MQSNTATTKSEIIEILIELARATEAVVTISDRKHDAWDAAKAAIAKAKELSHD